MNNLSNYDITTGTLTVGGAVTLTPASGVTGFADVGGQIFNVLAYGAKGGAVKISSAGSITSGQNTLSVTGASFVSSDVGKFISVNGAGTSGAVLMTTISSVTDSTDVVLAANASTTVTNQTVRYGYDDTSAIQSAINTAETASTSGGATVYLPHGTYFVTQLLLKTHVWLTGAGFSTRILQHPSSTSHLITGDADTDVWYGVRNMVLGGANDCVTASTDAIHFTNATSAGDKVHTIQNLWINKFSNNAIYLGNGCRSCHLSSLYVNAVSGVGLYLDTGATDSDITSMSIGQCGLQGVVVAGYNNRLTSVKAFMNGQVISSSGQGFLITANNAELVNCEAQQNLSHGYWLQNNADGALVNCNCDENAGDAYRLDRCFDCDLHGHVLLSDTTTQHTSIVNLVNSAARNTIRVTFDPRAVAAGTSYVQGTTTGNNILVGTYNWNGGGGHFVALTNPSQPTLTKTGSSTTATYAYQVTALDYGLNETFTSTTSATQTNAATLNGSNYNTVTWNVVPGAAAYRVYRVTATSASGNSATTGLLATVQSTTSITTLSYNDQGAAASGSVPTRNATADLTVDGNITVNAMSCITTGSAFIATATAASNTKNTTVSLVPTGVGTMTLPANFLVAGRTIKIRAMGVTTTTATSACTLTFFVKLGSTTIMTSAAVAPSAAATNVYWEMEALITCLTTGSSGTVRGQGCIWIPVSATVTDSWGMPSTATATINTTTTQLVDFQVTQSNSTNAQTVTCTNFTMEILN